MGKTGRTHGVTGLIGADTQPRGRGFGRPHARGSVLYSRGLRHKTGGQPSMAHDTEIEGNASPPSDIETDGKAAPAPGDSTRATLNTASTKPYDLVGADNGSLDGESGPWHVADEGSAQQLRGEEITRESLAARIAEG